MNKAFFQGFSLTSGLWEAVSDVPCLADASIAFWTDAGIPSGGKIRYDGGAEVEVDSGMYLMKNIDLSKLEASKEAGPPALSVIVVATIH